MFGFIKNKKVKTCDEVGQCLHVQLVKVLKEKETVFTKDDNSKELIFFYTYLTTLLHCAAYNKGIDTEFTMEDKYRKYVIDGVNPALWPHFLNAEALTYLYQDVPPAFDVESLIDEARDTAVYDSALLNSGDDMNLYRFMSNKKLLGLKTHWR